MKPKKRKAKAMSDDALIEWIAVYIMHWKKKIMRRKDWRGYPKSKLVWVKDVEGSAMWYKRRSEGIDRDWTGVYWKNLTLDDVDATPGMVPEFGDRIYASKWNPLRDWNAWRMVEEALLERSRKDSGTLLTKFLEQFVANMAPRISMTEYLRAGLPERARALRKAFYS